MIHSIQVLATHTTVVGLVVLVMGAGAAAWWLRRSGRTDRPYLLVFAALASLAVIVAVTLIRDRPTFNPGQLLHWSASGWQRISYDPLGNTENILNGVLFIPAGLTWTLLLHRPLRVLIGLMGLSLLVECLQAVISAGANDVADLITNSVGAGLGVVAGAGLLWLRSGGEARSRRWQLGWTAVAVVVGLVAVAVLLQAGAAYRQSALERELAGRFTGTSLEQYQQWEAEDRLQQEVFGVSSTFPDGALHLDHAVRLRYPASFFGLRRCVFVEWRPGTVRTTRGSGAECTDFLG